MLSAILHLVLPGAALVILMMFVLWLIHLRIGNASIVDPGWAFGLPLVAVTYAVMGSGYVWRRWLLAGMAVVWGVRLGSHLLRRIVGQPEEGRYQELRRQWKDHLAVKFLAFFEFQALLDLFLSLPFLLAALNPQPALSPLEYAGTALWVVSVGRRSRCRCATGRFQARPGLARTSLPARFVELLPAPELLLRVADLGGMGALCAGLPLWMDRDPVPAA